VPENKQIHLVSRPVGPATTAHFGLVVGQTTELKEGQVLVQHQYLSLDPYMRGRMSEAESYAAPQPLGQTMLGATAGAIVESLNPKLPVGTLVTGFGGWQQYSVVDAASAASLRVVGSRVPLSMYLGAVGMPGVTAWYGLEGILKVKQGATVVVSAAAGAVGSAFGVLAKERGLRVVGIAGGAQKVKYVVDDLGFDACLDYKSYSDAEALSLALEELCPRGIDGYFENVGGMVLNAVLPRMNAFSSIAVCGMISGYEGSGVPLANPSLILTKRLTVQGFIVGEHPEVWVPALKELEDLVASGRLQPRESIAQGLEAAPEAFLGLLKGKNFGKQLVKLI